MHTSEESKRIANNIRKWMVAHGKTLSTAESCTSGRIAAMLTAVDGASDYYQGGLVAYQDELKTQYLEVDAATIKECDVVSEPVVKQMVEGCCKRFGTDFAIASTGYTGSGSDRVPRGTVWVAWGTAEEVETRCLEKDCGREQNTRQAALAALEGFLGYLQQIP